MAAILVDYENVSASDGLEGVEYLNENDTLIVFYSQCCEKIRAEYIDFLRLKSETEEITVHTTPNIESALLSFNTLQDAERKKEIKEKTKSLNIGAEQARIKEHRAFGREDGRGIYQMLKNVV